MSGSRWSSIRSNSSSTSRPCSTCGASVGEVVGANLDPSHLFWQQMDPLAVIEALGPAIHLVHLKDTALVPGHVATAGVLDLRPFDDPDGRAWNFRTVGRGHDATFWRAFAAALGATGYAGSLSIEHEDRSEDPSPVSPSRPRSHGPRSLPRQGPPGKMAP